MNKNPPKRGCWICVLEFLTRQRSSFSYLNITQFLGAMNDNIFKLLIVYFLIDLVGIAKSPKILALAGAIFVAPFLLFSASSGMLADRISKSVIIKCTKALEVVAMLFGTLTFYYKMPWGAYGVLFLMATQSAIFSPSKYGIVPELVKEDKITKANGLLTSFTYAAMIIGTFLSSFLTDITGRNFVAAALVCVSIAVIGFLTSLGIEYTPPAGSTRRGGAFFLYEIYRTLRRIRLEQNIPIAVFGSAYFLFLGAFLQLNLIPYATEVLALTDTQGGYLFLVAAVGIGLGSLWVGRISQAFVELGVVPLAALALCVGSFLIDYFSFSLLLTIPTILFTGMAAGVYLIPLDTFIQVKSPRKIRGQVIAATNFLAFIGVLAASGMLIFINDILDLKADKGFTVFGFLTLGMALWMIFQLSDYLVRFLGMLLARICFQMNVRGQKNIPLNEPALLLCYRRSWSDALVLLGAQKQRVHFFYESPHSVSPWSIFFHRLLKWRVTPSLRPGFISQDTIEGIKQAMKKGRSVCLLLKEEKDEPLVLDALGSVYKKTLDLGAQPIIAVEIQRNPRPRSNKRVFNRLLRFLHVPTCIEFLPSIKRS